jgi:hypothetical protein
MSLGRKLALAAAAAALAPAASAQQKVTGPIATYWMSAQTQTGFGMPAGGGGDPQAMMRAMMGGGGANKSLLLQLGSTQGNPQPAADHLPPTGLQAGPALPLLTPRPQPAAAAAPGPAPAVPPEFQKPRGRMLIFWGCGERARPGQPVVIDFAKAASNPQAMAGLMKGIDYRPMQPPAPGRTTTYGEWPNERTQTYVPPNGSLVGDHTVRGNYNPEIRFALAEDQDFLGALNLNTNTKAPAGHVNLGWNLVPNALAYLAVAMGGDGETVAIWTSSETQAGAFTVPDYLSTPDITRLVGNRTLMTPGTRACAVPKEFVDAAPQAFTQLVAYGGEANFVHPPRPADPKVAWNQQWNVKVRYRSATGGLLGQPLPQLPPGVTADAPGQPPQRPGQPRQPPRRPSAADILRGGLPLPGVPRF